MLPKEEALDSCGEDHGNRQDTEHSASPPIHEGFENISLQNRFQNTRSADIAGTEERPEEALDSCGEDHGNRQDTQHSASPPIHEGSENIRLQNRFQNTGRTDIAGTEEKPSSTHPHPNYEVLSDITGTSASSFGPHKNIGIMDKEPEPLPTLEDCSIEYDHGSTSSSDCNETSVDHRPRRKFPIYDGAPDSKFRTYEVLVDPEQDDRAVEISLCSLSRPHMRSFHCAWLSFFVAFICWFAIAPLLSEVTISLALTKQQVWTSNMLSVTGSALLRIVIGPLCDKYGARLCICGILFVTSIPTMALGLANTVETFSILRLFIGTCGATFVTGQYWTSSMFTREVAGTANALVAGWGNLGGGITQIFSGSVLFPFFKWAYKNIDDGNVEIPMPEKNEFDIGTITRAEDLAWRSVPVVPGLISLLTAYFFYRYSDDSPKGNYHKRKKQGFIVDVKVWEALRTSASDINTWLLFLQYGCCFGVELTVSNAAALYFKEQFSQSTESAAAIASIFGWMNIFARGFGGFMSDMCNAWDGMRGRLAWQMCCLICEGLTTILFAYSKTLISSIFTLALFSFFVQAAEGSSFGIVPYVNPKVTGSIVGIVGAGGNVGGICFSLLFRQFSYEKAFVWMGICVICSSFFSFFVFIRGHAGLTCGKDNPEIRRVLLMMNMDEGENMNSVESAPEIPISTILDPEEKNIQKKHEESAELAGKDLHLLKEISMTVLTPAVGISSIILNP